MFQNKESEEEVESTTAPPSSALVRKRGRASADAVLSAPPSFSGDSAMVVIRSFCRFPPAAPARHSACRVSSEVFFYDVAKAACLPLEGAARCSRSRNRFSSVEACMDACVVEATRFSEEEED